MPEILRDIKNMHNYPVKSFSPKIIGTAIGALVYTPMCYFITKDWKFVIFISTTIVLFELVSFLYYSYLRNREKTSGNMKPNTIHGRYIVEKVKKSPFSKNNTRAWFMLSIVVFLAVSVKAIRTRWLIPIAICLDYILFEGYQYCKQVSSELFTPDDNFLIFSLITKKIRTSKEWSHKKTVIVALFLAITQILLLCSLIFITLGIVVPSTLYEFNRHCKQIFISENDTSTLSHRILCHIIPPNEDYQAYFFSVFSFVFIKLLSHYM